MATTSFFTDSQAQFNQSQKKLTELWDTSQKQLLESQKKLADTWMGSFSDGKPQVDVTENFEKTLNFQQELINFSLQSQQIAARLSLETQKQLWDTYFQGMQKVSQPPNS